MHTSGARSRSFLRMRIPGASSGRTINQRKPAVSAVTKKSIFTPKPIAQSPYTRTSIFATKPFRITKPTSSFYRGRSYTPILTKYSKPGVDYRARYQSEQSKNRNLLSRISKAELTLDYERATHKKEKAALIEQTNRYKASPMYAVDKVASDVTKRYAKATRIITPSINGIGSIGAIDETASKVGAGLLGLLFLGLIIGRVE